jgi:hypothetical protein
MRNVTIDKVAFLTKQAYEGGTILYRKCEIYSLRKHSIIFCIVRCISLSQNVKILKSIAPHITYFMPPDDDDKHRAQSTSRHGQSTFKISLFGSVIYTL